MALDSENGETSVLSASASGVWGRLLNLWRYCSIRVEVGFVDLVRSVTGTTERMPIATIDAVGWQSGRFGARLWLQSADGRRHEVRGLPTDQAALVVATIEQRAEALARTLEAQGRIVAARLDEWFSGADHLRRSTAQPIREQLDHLARESLQPSGELTLRCLSREGRAAFSRLQEVTAEGGFEHARMKANQHFVDRESQRAAQAMAGVSGFRPIPEQAAAVATDEDVTLVLAGAGTGKTAVISGKVAHLIENRGVAPEQILVLAYNTKAANELRQRLRPRYPGVDAPTFHAFVRRVVAETGLAPSISLLAEDRRVRRSWINERLETLLNDPEDGEQLREFILYNLGEYRSADKFERQGDYFRYIKRIELRTLRGERVKSMEELKIANFLSLHRVPYRYEPNYEAPTATRQHRQYRPDFYLHQHNIYIEHFGVDRDGEPPQRWGEAEREDYREGIEWKREIHATHGTDLIETYSWQHQAGSWQRDLREQLERRGVRLEPRPIEDLLPDLRRLMRRSALSDLLDAFLRQVKSADYSELELRRRTADAQDAQRAAAFLNLYAVIAREYEAELGDEYDFDDLINQAARRIDSGGWPSPYRYVLVDEFQDVSRGRMKLLAALRRPEVACFLVGDDWQSIYRFTGSDVGLLRECEAWLGPVERRQLSQTFRFGVGVLEPSAAFVQRNPAQTRRGMRPASRDPDHGVTLLWAVDEQAGLARVGEDLDRRRAARDASILLLGRYRRPQRTGPHRLNGRTAEQSTVHAAKGREADYVVVLDLANRRRGFPSQIDDDPLLDLVAPPAEPYELAEERRLFYVALTRARHGVYLLSDPSRPSAFVSELSKHSRTSLRPLGGDAVSSPESSVCPRCRAGRLARETDGRSLSCSLRPHCDFRAPACPCRRGFLLAESDGRARCTNRDCGQTIEHCPDCRSGVLIERRGPYGPFWGCSCYGAEPSCGYTRDQRRSAPSLAVRSGARAGQQRSSVRDRW
ncbi:MAG: UvrD-helicase domain-containing protein [Chloroflexi bacterium]|nr:UvrD-helicase domain-containing protein [Chloroflexota bacterium]